MNKDEEFKVFTKKKKLSGSKLNEALTRNQDFNESISSDSELLEVYSEDKADKLCNDFEIKAIKMSKTRYFTCFKQIFDNALLERNCNFNETVCYGLGNFLRNYISRSQLYFWLALKKQLNINQWFIFDPAFRDTEKSILIKLGFQLIDTNEKCLRKIENKFVLFYMPHCHKFMFNNLLWSNWNLNSLNNLFIIGNSFDIMTNTVAEKNDDQEYSYIHYTKNLNIVNEDEIDEKNYKKSIFNDLSLIYFNTNMVDKNKFEFCYSNSKPFYRENDFN